jgi:hypothetical protein
MSNTGGPAFPTHPVMGQISAPGLGMSLRDFFAAKALEQHGFLTKPYDTTDEAAKDCYRMADAMLKAREQK